MPAVLTHRDMRHEVLCALARADVPTTSAYFRASAPEAIPADIELRWQSLAEQLEIKGTPEADIAALRTVLVSEPPGEHAVAAFVSGGELQLCVLLDGYDGADVVEHGLPHVVPLLRWEQQRLAVVVAVVSRGHARVTAYDDDGTEVAVDDVVGDDDEIERNAPGGWSQPRYRRRAEDSWRHNARQFADHIARLSTGIAAQLILLAGDHREAGLVAENLPTQWRDLAVADLVAHTIAEGTAQVADEDIRSAVRSAARKRVMDRLGAFDAAVGSRRAVEGAADVRPVVDRGQAQELIVVAGAVASALADTLVAAALTTDAHVTVADSGDIQLVDGVGAVLRYA